MNEFFKNLSEVLSNLPDHPMAVISLVAMGVSILGYLFFVKEHPAYRVFVFVLIFLGAVGLVVEVLREKPVEETNPIPRPGNLTETGSTDLKNLDQTDRSNCDSYGCTTIRDCRREGRNIVCEWDIMASRPYIKNAWARIHQIALDDGRIFPLTEMHISNLHSFYFDSWMELGANSQKATQVPLGIKFPIRVVFGDVPVDGTPTTLLWQRKNGKYVLRMEVSHFFP